MNSSSASLIIRCLGENSDESLVSIYIMETNYIKVNSIVSMYYSLLDLLFLLNERVLYMKNIELRMQLLFFFIEQTGQDN